MKFDAGTRTRIFVDVTLDFDPTGSTIELRVDSAWHAATWQGSAVVGTGSWTQTAQTVDYFVGPDVTDQSGATPVALGIHEQEVRVTKGQDILTRDIAGLRVVA
jgi:hypothetical protein